MYRPEHRGASHIPLIEHEGKLCVILFAEPVYEINMDSGGHAEDYETPLDTVCREGREESLNTFYIEYNQIPNYVDYYTISNFVIYKNYYAFFVKYNISFQEIIDVYTNNREIIFGHKDSPKCWKESNNVNIFSVESLITGKPIDETYFWCVDMFGNNKVVHRRPIKYIVKAIERGIIHTSDSEWVDHDIPVKNVQIEINVTTDFLNGTKSIKIV